MDFQSAYTLSTQVLRVCVCMCVCVLCVFVFVCVCVRMLCVIPSYFIHNNLINEFKQEQFQN